MEQLNFSMRRVKKEIENFQIKKNTYEIKIFNFFDKLHFDFINVNNKKYLVIYYTHLDIFTQLEITQNYPFKPYNVVYFNSKYKVPYLNNLNNLTGLFNNKEMNIYSFFFKCLYSINPKFLNLNKNECYCCKSLMCTNEWCPSFTFTNLLLELIEVKFIECYSSNLSYRYIKNIYDTMFLKLPPDVIFHLIDFI